MPHHTAEPPPKIIAQAQQGDAKAIAWLCRHYGRLCTTQNHSTQLVDVQAAVHNALQKYDPKKGYKFGTYVAWYQTQNAKK